MSWWKRGAANAERYEEDGKDRPRREDVLLATASPDEDKPQRAAPVEVADSDGTQWSAA
jgi:hypothetical protein